MSPARFAIETAKIAAAIRVSDTRLFSKAVRKWELRLRKVSRPFATNGLAGRRASRSDQAMGEKKVSDTFCAERPAGEFLAMGVRYFFPARSPIHAHPIERRIRS